MSRPSEMGIDEVEIAPAQHHCRGIAYPYQTPVLVKYDSGDPMGLPRRRACGGGCRGFAERKAASERDGKFRGIGYSPMSRPAASRRRALPDVSAPVAASTKAPPSGCIRPGEVTVLIGTHNHGQGHETTFAQIVSEKLGVAFDKSTSCSATPTACSSAWAPTARDRWSSAARRSSKASDKVVAKGKKIAAHLLEAGEQRYLSSRPGSSRLRVPTAARRSRRSPALPMCRTTYPLEILEPGTGGAGLLRSGQFHLSRRLPHRRGRDRSRDGHRDAGKYTAVDDVGTVINPMIVEGQLHGGIAQGVGQALYRELPSMTRLRPAAVGLVHGLRHAARRSHAEHDDRDPFDALHAHPMGVKGCGEVGTIGSPAAVINSVVDALSHLGVIHVDMPATPNRIWRVIQNATMPRAAE